MLSVDNDEKVTYIFFLPDVDILINPIVVSLHEIHNLLSTALRNLTSHPDPPGVISSRGAGRRYYLLYFLGGMVSLIC